MNSRCLKIMIVLIPSRSICQMLTNFSGDEFKRTAFELKKEKESRFLDFAPSRKRETKTFMVVQLRPKKCKKKKVLDVQSCWCPFSLPSPSSLVKLPSNADQSQHRQQLNEPIGRQKVSSAGDSHEWKLRLGLVLFWLLKKWREILEPIIKHDTEAFLRQFSLKYLCPETNAAQAASQC